MACLDFRHKSWKTWILPKVLRDLRSLSSKAKISKYLPCELKIKYIICGVFFFLSVYSMKIENYCACATLEVGCMMSNICS